jgi:predicted alpha-1,6-mannanase (GH76 family)
VDGEAEAAENDSEQQNKQNDSHEVFPPVRVRGVSAEAGYPGPVRLCSISAYSTCGFALSPEPAGPGGGGGGPLPGYPEMAKNGIDVLQHWYSARTGRWASAGWWNAANALTAVIRYMRYTGDRSYLGVVETTFTRARRRHRGFTNNFFDDNGWWALAWVDAYDLTGQRRYLTAAQSIFTANLDAWDATCGGGLWWNQQRKYKNAITNELFLSLAALLHQRTAGGDYLDWALREWRWLHGSGMIGPAGLVNDGLTAACENNQGITWTYNQGVILGGLAALHDITGDPGYLRQGEVIADAALRTLVRPPGILAEPNEPSGCDGDQTQFKGIFIRYLAEFWRRSRQPAYPAFIMANADSVWANARDPAGRFGLRWGGPFDQADASRQSSAVEVLTAAAAVGSVSGPRV